VKMVARKRCPASRGMVWVPMIIGADHDGAKRMKNGCRITNGGIRA
jgi:hypothetical protein